MKNFIGIDLGTTNSAICSYDGTDTRVWKSHEQNDVTPSAIYIDKRGNKYVGQRAYNVAAKYPDNSAVLFKRLMGTSTPISFPALKLTKTPEECSAEVLKVLFGYLPEEIRNDSGTGTVITVPAAFNQMQKDATMQAANMAGIGLVALMQEPVAAVMSVMRTKNAGGVFLIFDMGGGTLDVAIAKSADGKGVSLLAHGGIAMCGGRDFDRAVVDNIVRPWLQEKFDMPKDFFVNPKFKKLIRMVTQAAEQAKIELSAREESTVYLPDAEVNQRDLSGHDIYVEILLRRDAYDKLISERVGEAILTVREALSKAGLAPRDLERVVFVGGPTYYKPLRDKVASELGVQASIDVNPMTAVAEGASIFAESIDWTSGNRSRKSARGQISSAEELKLSFGYSARTPNANARIMAQLGSAAAGFEFQVDSIDTGWTSGRLPLKHGTVVDVALSKNGDNAFKVLVFDQAGGAIAMGQNRIVITRTAATVEAIPASHSIAIEAMDKPGGRNRLDYLVRAGNLLPIHGKKMYKASETLRAGSNHSINIKLWEGEIEEPIGDNRPIGVFKIRGTDFSDGVIPAGADLECEYEILDSGHINLTASVPSIGGTFRSGRNFYSRLEGQLDYTAVAGAVMEDGKKTLESVNEISKAVNDSKLEQARKKLENALSLAQGGADAEKTQEAMEKILEAKKLIAQVRKDNLKKIRQAGLDSEIESFGKRVRQYARPAEISAFDNLAKAAQQSIAQNDKEFERHIGELRDNSLVILGRQPWFVTGLFDRLKASPATFVDKQRFDDLVERGEQCKRADDVDKLRQIINELLSIRIDMDSGGGIAEMANIISG
ncbi:MAG: Hsp70 family protein [Chitinispirillales bacterium]|jgi:molecular chaperone DnaK|nr:Hsp70 family protein [Chitinispirillales bacterium]